MPKSNSAPCDQISPSMASMVVKFSKHSLQEPKKMLRASQQIGSSKKRSSSLSTGDATSSSSCSSSSGADTSSCTDEDELTISRVRQPRQHQHHRAQWQKSKSLKENVQFTSDNQIGLVGKSAGDNTQLPVISTKSAVAEEDKMKTSIGYDVIDNEQMPPSAFGNLAFIGDECETDSSSSSSSSSSCPPSTNINGMFIASVAIKSPTTNEMLKNEEANGEKKHNLDQELKMYGNQLTTLKINDKPMFVFSTSTHLLAHSLLEVEKCEPLFKIPFDAIVAIYPCVCIGSFFASTLSLNSQSKAKKATALFSACTRTKLKLICDCHNLVRADEVTRCPQVKLYFAEKGAKGAYLLKCLRISRTEANEETQHALARLVAEVKVQIQNQKKNRPKNLLVFVNPFGGSGEAPKIFEEKARPIFELAQVKYVKFETERKDHARDTLLNALDLKSFDGIVCVGGDGMFTEVLNSVIVKTQEEKKIDVNSPEQHLEKPSIPLGIVPAGSTNALGNTVNGFDCILNSILAIVLGNKLSIDVSSVHQRDTGKLLTYSSNFMGYGFLGDTLVESEKQRWMGPQRYNWAGFKKFLQLRSYCGELKMCIEPKDGRPTDVNPCDINCKTCKQAGERPKDQLGEHDKPSCILIRKNIVAINSATIPCRCEKSKMGVSPMSHLGNGCTDLIVVEKCSRLDYFRYLLRLAKSQSNLFDFDFIQTYRVREFEFTPVVGLKKKKAYTFEQSFDNLFDENSNTSAECILKTKKQQQQQIPKSEAKHDKKSGKDETWSSSSSEMPSSVWNVDGEVINEAAVHVKIHCQLITLFATGVDFLTLLPPQ